MSSLKSWLSDLGPLAGRQTNMEQIWPLEILLGPPEGAKGLFWGKIAPFGGPKCAVKVHLRANAPCINETHPC